jgi:hypothetical protein
MRWPEFEKLLPIRLTISAALVLGSVFAVAAEENSAADTIALSIKGCQAPGSDRAYCEALRRAMTRCGIAENGEMVTPADSQCASDAMRRYEVSPSGATILRGK